MASEKRLIDADDCGRYIASRMGFSQASLENVMQYMEDYTKQYEVDAVEVVHGRWEDEYGGAFTNPRYRCSVCKGKALYRHEQNSLGGWEAVQALTDYCPNCGAKMDGGTDRESSQIYPG